MNEDVIFSELIRAFRKRIRQISTIFIFFLICGGAVGYWIPPVYEAELDVLVNASTAISKSTAPSMGDIDTSLRLVETYKQIMKSDRVNNRVNQALEGKYPKNVIRKKIKIESGNGSQIITIIAKDHTAEDVAKLANTYANIFKEEIKELMNLDNVTIMAEVSAKTDTTKVKPDLFYYFFISIFAGALTCVAFILIQEIHFGNLDSEAKISKALQLPLLGSIKKMKLRKRKNGTLSTHELIFRRSKNSDFGKLAANVVHQMKKENIKIILVTSAVKREGKSFIASHLAAALAGGGNKTVFVDADLRKSDGSVIYNLTDKRGMTSILNGSHSLLESFQSTEHSYLNFLGTGPVPTERFSLLQSREWATIMEDLRSVYEFIIIDAPDMTLPDVYFLLPTVDSVLFVLDKKTSKKNVVKSVQSILQLDGDILGVVTNRHKGRI